MPARVSLPHDEQYKKGILSMIANRILFCPAEERTARELQQLPQKEREQVWADMTANPETTFYRNEPPQRLYSLCFVVL
jgi:hypothetical protein